jgi:Tol biopolymer transport system component
MVARGEPRPVAGLGPVVDSPAISLRGNRLAYEVVSSDTNVWRYSLPAAKGGAEPVKLIASTLLDSEARISPDGSRVAFSSTRSGRREIWTCDRDGSNLLRLTSLEASCGSPRWSPDGRRIAFDSDLKGNWDVFVVGAEGGPPRALTQTEGEDSRPSWSHDGRWIYFGSSRSGSYQVWKVSPEGGDAVQVTRGGGYNPLESPDGRFLYFAKGPTERGIWRLPVEGGEEAAVLPELAGVGGSARWDVASNGVYFVEFRADASLGKWLLRLLRSDVSEVTDVMELPPPAGGACLDVSPDEPWLLYTQNDVLGSDLMLVENFK